MKFLYLGRGDMVDPLVRYHNQRSEHPIEDATQLIAEETGGFHENLLGKTDDLARLLHQVNGEYDALIVSYGFEGLIPTIRENSTAPIFYLTAFADSQINPAEIPAGVVGHISLGSIPLQDTLAERLEQMVQKA